MQPSEEGRFVRQVAAGPPPSASERRFFMVKIRLAALVALLVLLTAPAFALGGARGVSAVSYPVSVQAANGAAVIQARPTRIVSLAPSATEDLFAIGAGSQVVAVDDQSNYPASVPRTDLSGYT